MTAVDDVAAPVGGAAGCAPEAAQPSGELPGAAAAGGGGLGTSRNALSGDSPAVSEDAQRRRALRFERRRVSSAWLIGAAREELGLDPDGAGAKAGSPDWVRPPRVARCSWGLGVVGVHRSADGRASFSNCERCASASCCPVCSAVIRYERGQNVLKVYEAVQSVDEPLLWGLFLTLTIRHKRGHTFQETLDTLTSAWRGTVR